MNRRDFLKKGFFGSALLATSQFPFTSMLAGEVMDKLIILHTNDTHSRIEPFPNNDKNFPGMGGVSRRAQLIQAVRQKNPHVLLLDAGDFLQGTPYFNMYRGEVEIQAMNEMAYDACTFGNHEFDVGMDRLEELIKVAKFPFISSNYDFSKTNLNGLTHAYKIFQKGPFKIGVMGVGVKLYGIASQESYGKTWVNDALKSAQKTSKFLKEKEKCNVVICLSHLGYSYEQDYIMSDIKLAQNTEFIDIIIGGHTHTFIDEPVMINNLRDKPVMINQMGWGGTRLGQIELSYSLNKKIYYSNSNTVIIGK